MGVGVAVLPVMPRQYCVCCVAPLPNLYLIVGNLGIAIARETDLHKMEK